MSERIVMRVGESLIAGGPPCCRTPCAASNYFKQFLGVLWGEMYESLKVS